MIYQRPDRQSLGGFIFSKRDMEMKKLAILQILVLTGCATIVNSGPDIINITTSDGYPVPAQVISKAGVQQVWLPTVISVPKSCSNISINVKEDYQVYASNTVATSSVNPWVFGNIIFGGIPGLIIDGIAGNMCTYDNNIIVPIYPK